MLYCYYYYQGICVGVCLYIQIFEWIIMIVYIYVYNNNNVMIIC